MSRQGKPEGICCSILFSISAYVLLDLAGYAVSPLSLLSPAVPACLAAPCSSLLLPSASTLATFLPLSSANFSWLPLLLLPVKYFSLMRLVRIALVVVTLVIVTVAVVVALLVVVAHVVIVASSAELNYKDF